MIIPPAVLMQWKRMAEELSRSAIDAVIAEAKFKSNKQAVDDRNHGKG